MTQIYFSRKKLIKSISLFGVSLSLIAGVLGLAPASVNPTAGKAAAACINTAPATTYGQVTQTVNVTTAGTYRVWSRIKAPSTAANSYYFEVDGGCAYNVGDSTAIPVNTWTWVNYQDATTTSTINVTLTAGSHTLTYTGKEADVQLDKVMLLTDTACVPTGTGDNCAVNDNVSPTVSVTAPTAGSTVTGSAVNITANAADNSGISKVEFLVDDVVVGTDTTSAYSYTWDSTKSTNGTHRIQARAYDTKDNVGTSTAVSVTVAVKTTDTTAPSVPGSLTSTAKTATSVSLQWAASTDNVAIKGYRIFRGATQVGTTAGTLTYTDTGLTAGTAYSYTVKAVDSSDNLSAASTALSVTTTATNTTDTTAPTVSITAPAAGTSVTVGTGVTISATASDNVAVTKVEILVDGAIKATDTSSPYSYAWDTSAVAAGAHAITAKAYDAAGNTKTSTAVSVTLTAPTTTTTPGDVNGDKRVNALDLSALISHDGQNYPAADFNKDGTVGAADMAILLAKWTW